MVPLNMWTHDYISNNIYQSITSFQMKVHPPYYRIETAYTLLYYLYNDTELIESIKFYGDKHNITEFLTHIYYIKE
jgi:hypothetical protein